jgi:hypothetical protein
VNGHVPSRLSQIAMIDFGVLAQRLLPPAASVLLAND